MPMTDISCARRAMICERLKTVLADLDDLSEHLAATHVNDALEAICTQPAERRVAPLAL